MEGAQTLEGTPAGGLQCDVFGDVLVNSGTFANEGNVLVSDPARHVGSLRPVRTSPVIQG